MAKRNFAKVYRSRKFFSFATIIGFMLVIACFLLINRKNLAELIHYYNQRNKEVAEINQLKGSMARLEKAERDLALNGFENEKAIRDTQRWAKPGEVVIITEK
jgi:cell division protein FtsB